MSYFNNDTKWYILFTYQEGTKINYHEVKKLRPIFVKENETINIIKCSIECEIKIERRTIGSVICLNYLN